MYRFTTRLGWLVAALTVAAATLSVSAQPAAAIQCRSCYGDGDGGGSGGGGGGGGGGTSLDSGWFNVPESTGHVDTGINVDSNDEVQITADSSYTIWAGVWFTGRNGPAGWTGSQATDPKFPLHGDTDRFGHIIRPYSLLAEIDNSTYNGTPLYQVGDGYTATVASGSGSHRVILKINDDTLANGDGAFRAYMQVTRKP